VITIQLSELLPSLTTSGVSESSAIVSSESDSSSSQAIGTGQASQPNVYLSTAQDDLDVTESDGSNVTAATDIVMSTSPILQTALSMQNSMSSLEIATSLNLEVGNNSTHLTVTAQNEKSDANFDAVSSASFFSSEIRTAQETKVSSAFSALVVLNKSVHATTPDSSFSSTMPHYEMSKNSPIETQVEKTHFTGSLPSLTALLSAVPDTIFDLSSTNPPSLNSASKMTVVNGSTQWNSTEHMSLPETTGVRIASSDSMPEAVTTSLFADHAVSTSQLYEPLQLATQSSGEIELITSPAVSISTNGSWNSSRYTTEITASSAPRTSLPTQTSAAPFYFTVIMPMTGAEFRSLSFKFIAAVAAAANCNQSWVQVIAVRETNGRRLQESSIEVDTKILLPPELNTNSFSSPAHLLTQERIDKSLSVQGLPPSLGVKLEPVLGVSAIKITLATGVSTVAKYSQTPAPSAIQSPSAALIGGVVGGSMLLLAICWSVAVQCHVRTCSVRPKACPKVYSAPTFVPAEALLHYPAVSDAPDITSPNSDADNSSISSISSDLVWTAVNVQGSRTPSPTIYSRNAC
jgi:hypothetical protein